MNLLVIYGPPAIGKLTVAKEVEKITDYKVFHNHLTFDIVDLLFDREEDMDVFWELTEKIRLNVFEIAAREDINLIYTTCHPKEPEGSENHFKKVIDTVEKQGGSVYFTRLYCDKEKLFERVQEESREKYDKVTDPETLEEILDEYDWQSEIEFVDNLNIDNTNLSPKEVAKKIKNHYEL